MDCESSKSQDNSSYEPNYEMLKKLHSEMRKLSQDSSTEVQYSREVVHVLRWFFQQVTNDFRVRHLLMEKGVVLTKS